MTTFTPFFRNNFLNMRYIQLSLLFVFLCISRVPAQENTTSGAESSVAENSENRDDKRFEVGKQLDIFNALVKEVEMFYVDPIEVDKFMQRGINAMLRGLDPYTVYIAESEDLNFITTGEYGGIGAYITSRNGGTMISGTGPFEKMPAAEAGLKAGDIILAVDGVDAQNLPSEKVTELLKGIPNSKVSVTIQRPGEKKTQKFDLVRKRVVVEQVVHYGVYGDKTGYIYLEGFKDKSAQEVKAAFEDLMKNHQIESLILDLRDNGGGLLESAVQIVNLFVPRGIEVLSSKGKISQRDRTYRTYHEPINTEIPLVVLINGNTASASEIVSGALQDMDRATLVGQRSFGKGLVQTPRNLPYDGKLLVTTEKYYIPSGRCIQQLDYTHRNADGSVDAIPDSLTSVFYTKNGRPVRDGGGIRPDFEVEESKIPTMLYYLQADRNFYLFDYVTDWVYNHKTIPPPTDFVYSDEDYESFKKYLIEKNFEYDRQSIRALNSLKEIADFEGYLEEGATLFAALEEKLSPNLERDLERYKEDIKHLISSSIIERYYYRRGVMQYSLRDDKTLQKALDILKDKELYYSTLTNNK